MAKAVDVMDVLAARDSRAARQQELLALYARPLISFTMNIAGPIKRTAPIEQGFDLGLARLEGQLRTCRAAVLHRETVRRDTGCEALYAVDLPAPQLKELCMALEECDELGRLFDLDVLDIDGSKLARTKVRGCLIFTFMAGSAALQPYFVRCAAIGQETAQEAPQTTFAALRPVGRLAEGEMLRATGGVNTHKGAIFILGLACAALGRLGRNMWHNAGAILDECAAMTTGVTAELAGAENTAGERFCRDYGVHGIRGEAETGFPAVRTAGVPALEGALTEGKTLEQAGCEALLALMSVSEDTALLHRAGYDGWQETKRRAAQILHQGATYEALERFDRDMIAQNRSPGGSADLLAATYFIHTLTTKEASL